MPRVYKSFGARTMLDTPYNIRRSNLQARATQRDKKIYSYQRFMRSTIPRPINQFIQSTTAPELKFWDIGSLGVNGTNQFGTGLNAVLADCSTTGSLTLINGIAEGNDYNQRVGRKFSVRSVQIQGTLTPGTTSSTWTQCRLMVVVDYQPVSPLNLATLMGNIFQNAGAVNGDSRSFLNLNYRERFKIIADVRYAMGPIVQAASVPTVTEVNSQIVKIYRKCAVVVNNSGTDASVGSISTGAMYFITVGDSATGSAYGFSGMVRIRFADP